MRYAKDGRQILQFTGWHRDGTPLHPFLPHHFTNEDSC